MTESVVPAGKTPMDLTVMELDYCSRNLKVDVMHAMSAEGHPSRVKALAYIVLCWQKRQDPAAKIEPLLSLQFAELMAMATPPKTGTEPAAAMTPEEELAANPTDSAQG